MSKSAPIPSSSPSCNCSAVPASAPTAVFVPTALSRTPPSATASRSVPAAFSMTPGVAAGAVIGPYSHLRPGSDIGEGAHVGNFVETKKIKLGKGSKANHLTYLGDAEIGAGVNIGAGTITCNYDGVHKHKTTSATASSSAATRPWSPRSQSAKAPTSPPPPASPKTFLKIRSPSAAPARSPKKAGLKPNARSSPPPERHNHKARNTSVETRNRICLTQVVCAFTHSG